MRRRVEPTARQRRAVRERAAGRCEYCRCPDSHSLAPFSVDHIVPVSADGPTVLDNLAYACLGCNGAKHDAAGGPDPETGRDEPLFHPRRAEWATHFAWNDDFTRVIGRTPSGRTTASALDLDRPGVVNLRRLLHAAGLHPPPD